MQIPSLLKEEVGSIVRGVTHVGEPKRGGQKLVFPCVMAGRRYVLKFMLAAPSGPHDAEEDEASSPFDAVAARARREVATMGECDSPHVVKLGPIPLTVCEHRGQSLIYFSEEFIDGQDLRAMLREHPRLPVADLVRLACHTNEAIRVLWGFSKIHRDIKPGNIMNRSTTGEFVLLDMGLAFDLEDESFTGTGLVPGTPRYFSPEQMDFARKRQMDFRSDLFSLGIVLYEAACGRHPFRTHDVQTTYQFMANILAHVPPRPVQLRPEIPEQLSDVIMRLLAKHPHLRYRSCERLHAALAHIQHDLEEGH